MRFPTINTRFFMIGKNRVNPVNFKIINNTYIEFFSIFVILKNY